MESVISDFCVDLSIGSGSASVAASGHHPLTLPTRHRADGIVKMRTQILRIYHCVLHMVGVWHLLGFPSHVWLQTEHGLAHVIRMALSLPSPCTEAELRT